MNDNICVVSNESESNLMNNVQQLAFAINDLALYLDTHPTDMRALQLFNEYVLQYKNALNEYQRKYGPLSYYSQINSWKWINNPWPWEGVY